MYEDIDIYGKKIKPLSYNIIEDDESTSELEKILRDDTQYSNSKNLLDEIKLIEKNNGDNIKSKNGLNSYCFIVDDILDYIFNNDDVDDLIHFEEFSVKDYITKNSNSVFNINTEVTEALREINSYNRFIYDCQDENVKVYNPDAKYEYKKDRHPSAMNFIMDLNKHNSR